MKNYTRIPNKLLRCAALNQSEFRVLLILMSIKPCYPSRADLSKWSGLGINTIQRALKSLRTKGIVSWKRGHGYGKNNRYFVDYKKLAKVVSNRAKNDPITRAKMYSLKRLIWKEEKTREYSDDELEQILASLPGSDQ